MPPTPYNSIEKLTQGSVIVCKFTYKMTLESPIVRKFTNEMALGGSMARKCVYMYICVYVYMYISPSRAQTLVNARTWSVLDAVAGAGPEPAGKFAGASLDPSDREIFL